MREIYMYYLIYASQSKKGWDESEIRALLEKSVQNNKNFGITGLLIFLKDRFIQLLEGERKNVYFIYDKIKQDPRHEKLIVLLEGVTEERIFKEWSMGFKAMDQKEFEKLSGYTKLEDLFEETPITNKSHPALIFLKLFYEKNYRDFEQIS